MDEIHYYPNGLKMEGFWMNSSRYRYSYNGIEELTDFGLNLHKAAYRLHDPALGKWNEVDPKATSLMSLSPYNSMGNSPLVNADPNGDLFFAIPQIGIGSSGSSFGLEVGVGIPGVLSASVTGGAGSDGGYWSVQGSAYGLYAGYGSSGGFAGVGYQYAGVSGGLNYGKGGLSAGLGYGGSIGNGYAGSIGLNYGKNGLGFNASVSSTYMWGEISPGATTEPGGGELQGGTDGTIRGNTGLYEDETLAYNVMVEQTQFMGVETAAWLTDAGVLVSPIATPEYSNTAKSSSNSFYRVTGRGKDLFAHHLGQKYKITGQVHTHPSLDVGPWRNNTGKVVGDKLMAQTLRGNPVYTIGPTRVHSGIFSKGIFSKSFVGTTRSLLIGKYKLIK